ALSGPSTATAGATISVTDTTANQGTGGAGATVTTYYLSRDTQWDASDVTLLDRSVPALAAGASDTGTGTVTIPAGTATGSYYIVAYADGRGVVAESQEGNNQRAVAIQIGP